MPDALDGEKNNKGKNYIVNSYLFVRKQLMLQKTQEFIVTSSIHKQPTIHYHTQYYT